MPNYQFVGQAPRLYDIVTPQGSLIAENGDVCEFENPPTDGLWVETDAPVNDKSGRSWPIKADEAQPDANPETAAESGQSVSIELTTVTPLPSALTQEISYQ
jgi:hypothetical protein